MRFLKNLFHAEELPPNTHCATSSDKKTVKKCPMCSAVKTAGRSGEKTLHFVNDDVVKIEIINESNVPGRMCYTLNTMNDPEIGWNDVPIKFCPWCGGSLRRPKK